MQINILFSKLFSFKKFKILKERVLCNMGVGTKVIKKIAVARGFFFLPLFVFYETCVGSPLIAFVILKEVPKKGSFNPWPSHAC